MQEQRRGVAFVIDLGNERSRTAPHRIRVHDALTSSCGTSRSGSVLDYITEVTGTVARPDQSMR